MRNLSELPNKEDIDKTLRLLKVAIAMLSVLLVIGGIFLWCFVKQCS